MRYKLLSTLAIIIALGNACAAFAQGVNDTIFNPKIVFSGMPKKYEIAGIKVSGVENYEDNTIIGYSGLAVGQRVEIPGDELKTAAKRFWRQGLFSKVQIKVEKICGDKAWIEFCLRQQPRISQVNYRGIKKGEQKDLDAKLGLVKGYPLTPNSVDRIKLVTKRFFDDKGFKNSEVNVERREDLSNPNEVIVDIVVNKHEKVKVHRIYVHGNKVLSEAKVRDAMKKTNEKGLRDWVSIKKIFSQKKFVPNDYKDDKDKIIGKYNELGYRDAVITSDSVVPYDEKTVDIHISVEEGHRYFISDISWMGNTVYSTDVLNQVLGMKKGDVYNQKLLTKRTIEDEDAVSSLYMDNGYLFYNLTPIETKVEGDSVALQLRMDEGKQARINKVIINGSDRLYEKVVRRELRVRPGELFSKSDLMRSAREIAQTGHFDPEKMKVDPRPNPEDGTVDIVLDLESKANDQIELSAGWGQTGVIAKVALKFNNFSMKNLFHPSSYRGIIPQGEGQQLTISAQTNASYYQSYQISFLDPWFGGKRPNQFYVSGFYSRQTGINQSYYNQAYYNAYNSMMMNSYGYGYGNYGYGNNYYNNAYENSYDPNKYLQMLSFTVGFGKRLSWPDDYFTAKADLTYQWYKLKNWEYLYYMKNGVSNSLVLGLTLERNSIDNPYYTRRGSSFMLSLQMTPPASLFGKKDWKALAELPQTTEVVQQKYRWIEYWKLKFKSRTYTPIANADGKYTPVLMTRADIGLLGSWNKYLKSPFETFYVGGDGMSGSYNYATENIALRGYDNGAFTPYGYEGYAYTRFALELHFPFMLETSSTIYGLAFLEGGNAWTSVSQFNPFDIKRSAGVGVRIFLPMVGMLGIDWGYGFDKDAQGNKGGSHFHFVLGQEF
ncbi:MAG: outer membrane protein assembly factor BamA [Muribaculaceae bacterium]|nr:outer membrane protein assembly factor BamA [Muribaculaceae bacterium]